MAAAPQAGMKKRQVIANSNRTMFIWVAAMSAVVGICAVLAYFLIQQIIFKGSVADENAKTASILSKNLKVIPTLTQNLQVMETNTALNSAKATPEEKALRVILDALPADANTLALGSSLQQKLAADIPGVSIDSLTINPVDETEGAGSTATPGQLTFQMVVKSSNADGLKQLLAKFEKSIRTIDIDALTVERGEGSYTMTMQAHAYYEPATTINLGTKTVMPNGKIKK